MRNPSKALRASYHVPMRLPVPGLTLDVGREVVRQRTAALADPPEEQPDHFCRGCLPQLTGGGTSSMQLLAEEIEDEVFVLRPPAAGAGAEARAAGKLPVGDPAARLRILTKVVQGGRRWYRRAITAKKTKEPPPSPGSPEPGSSSVSSPLFSSKNLIRVATLGKRWAKRALAQRKDAKEQQQKLSDLSPKEAERRILLAGRGPKRDSGSRTATPTVQLRRFNERRRLGWEVSWDGKSVQLHPEKKLAELALVDPRRAETQRIEHAGHAADAAALERLRLEKQNIMELISGGHWETYSGKASWIPALHQPLEYLTEL
eukprot:COSAG05_NODE_898_length_6685_cov_4.419223_11_plen_317_part_00